MDPHNTEHPVFVQGCAACVARGALIQQQVMHLFPALQSKLDARVTRRRHPTGTRRVEELEDASILRGLGIAP